MDGRQSEQLKRLRGRRSPERVIGPLLGTRLFSNMSDLLPLDEEKHADAAKTIKLLQDIKSCSEQLIRAGRETLRPKINDIPTFDGTTLALLGITSGTYLGFKLQKDK
jgi:hypothetical protein